MFGANQKVGAYVVFHHTFIFIGASDKIFQFHEQMNSIISVLEMYKLYNYLKTLMGSN